MQVYLRDQLFLVVKTLLLNIISQSNKDNSKIKTKMSYQDHSRRKANTLCYYVVFLNIKS